MAAPDEKRTLMMSMLTEYMIAAITTRVDPVTGERTRTPLPPSIHYNELLQEEIEEFVRKRRAEAQRLV